MDLSFNIDFDAGEVYGVVDGSLSFTVIKDEHEYIYKNFDRLDDDVVQDKIKEVCRLLLSIEEA